MLDIDDLSREDLATINGGQLRPEPRTFDEQYAEYYNKYPQPLLPAGPKWKRLEAMRKQTDASWVRGAATSYMSSSSSWFPR